MWPNPRVTRLCNLCGIWVSPTLVVMPVGHSEIVTWWFFRVQLHYVTCGSASTQTYSKSSGCINLASLAYLVLALSCLSAYLYSWLLRHWWLTHTPIFNHSPVHSCASQHCHVASHVGNPTLHSSLSQIRPWPRYFLNRPAIIDVDLATDLTLTHTPPTPGLLSSLHPSQLLSHTCLRLIALQMCEAIHRHFDLFYFPNQVSLSSILFLVPSSPITPLTCPHFMVSSLK